MGMYDCINGEQIKCFYLPIFNDNWEDEKSIFKEPTWHSGGLFRDFKDGDTVPTQTSYYKLPDSFLIFDEERLIHIIKDKKILKTVYISEFKQEDFIDYVIGYRGTKYNIKSGKEFKLFIENDNEIRGKIIELRKDLDSMLDRARNLNLEKKRLNFRYKRNKYSTIISEIKEEFFNKNNSLFNGLLFEELKEDYAFEKIKDNFDNIYELLKVDLSKNDEEFNAIIREYDKLNKEIEPKCLKLQEEFRNRWVSKDEYFEEKQFGEILDLIYYSIINIKDIDIEKDNIDSNTESMCKVAKKYLNEFDDIFNRYLKWQEVEKDSEEYLSLELLKDIIINSKYSV